MGRPTTSDYGIVVFIIIIYYLIATAIVYYHGKKWFVPVWSFPIILFVIYGLCFNREEEIGALQLYTIATFALLIILGIMLWVISLNRTIDRSLLMVITIAAWLIVSVSIAQFVDRV